MKSIRESIHDIISECVMPRIESDGISKLILPEQFTPADCMELEVHKKGVHRPHREPSLAIGLTGRIPYWIGDKVFVFTPGRIVLLPGGTVQTSLQKKWRRTSKVDPDWPFSILWLIVYPFGVQVQVLRINYEADAVEATQPCMFLGRQFATLTIWLLEEVRFKPTNYTNVGRYILLEFMERFLRSVTIDMTAVAAFPRRRRARSGRRKSASAQNKQQDKLAEAALKQLPIQPDATPLPGQVQAARDFIHSNYNKSVGLDDIADAVNTDTDYLGRQFKAVTGMTLIQYLISVRMEAARELLLTDLKVLEVARLVGIEDQCYFSRLFRRFNGATPLQYRRRITKATPTPLGGRGSLRIEKPK